MFEEDLSIFFQEFGCAAFINGKSIVGLLNNHPHSSESFNLIDVTFITLESETVAVNLGDKLLIESQSYEIFEKVPDGLGLMHLRLGKSRT